MNSDRPSRTARFVAFGRASADAGITNVADFKDPTARHFLDNKTRAKLDQLLELARSGKQTFGLSFARVMGDMMAMRTSAIDASVRDAIAAGATQLVILGAGYDGRAWRMPELSGVRVFEVDHPATQEDKRKRVTELPPAIGDVTFVSINFETEALAAVLERAGHDPATPTCWIWEGVVMYLTNEAMRGTLAGLAGRSAPGSTLIVNYHTERRRFFARLIFRLIGEPQISAWKPDEMAAELRPYGFAVRDDSGMLDWNNRFAGGRGTVQRGAYMRIVVARKV